MFYMVTVLNGVLRWARLIPIAVINLLIWLCLGTDPIDLIEMRTRNEMFHNVLQIRCWLWTSDTGVSVPTSGPNDLNPPPVYSPPPVLYVQLNWLEVHRIVNKLIDRRDKEGTYCVLCHVVEWDDMRGSIRMIRLYDGMYPMPNDMLAENRPPHRCSIKKTIP